MPTLEQQLASAIDAQNALTQAVAESFAVFKGSAPNVIRANLLNPQVMPAATEVAISSTPSIADCDYYQYDAASASYVIKKEGLYQIAMHVGYEVNISGYWYDVIQYIKAYKNGVIPSNANYFATAGGWQSFGHYSGVKNPQPKTFYNRLACRLGVGDKIRFIHWLTQTSCTLQPESPSSTQSSFVEFAYLGA